MKVAKLIDLTGKRFSRLLVIEMAESYQTPGGARWLAACDCGAQKIVSGDSLRAGNTKSCGCLAREAGNRTRTHGMTKTSTYNIWCSMIARCEKPSRKDYFRYGGRGISVCERWHVFSNFFADMGERPSGKSLDRYPNAAGNYEPGNCRWATASQQVRNSSVARLVTICGKTQHVTEWLAEYSLNAGTYFRRRQRGWSEEMAICTRPNQTFNSKRCHDL